MSDTANVKLILNEDSNITNINILVEKGFKNKLKLKALKSETSLSDITRGLLENWLNGAEAEPKKKKLRKIAKNKKSV